MIEIDQGRHLTEIFYNAASMKGNIHLTVSMPFFDMKSRIWKLLVQTAYSGTTIRLFTRMSRNIESDALIRELRFIGDHIDVIELPNLHAKAVILYDKDNHTFAGWVGSSNFIASCDKKSLELGVYFAGKDKRIVSLCRQVIGILYTWEQAFRLKRNPFPLLIQKNRKII